MPIFEYLCQDCGREFETFVTGERKPACPGCQGANLGKLLSAPGMVGRRRAIWPAARRSRRLADAAPAARCACRANAN